MQRRAIVLAIMFTLLWTGSFAHDFFGVNVLPRVAGAISALISTSSSPALINEHVWQSEHDEVLAHYEEQEPPPSHEHAPWSLGDSKDPTAKFCQSLIIALAIWRNHLFRSDFVLATSHFERSVEHLEVPAQRVYLSTRRLLI